MNKTLKILIPCIAGFLAMLICWHFYAVIQNNIHSDEDLVFGWISPFDLEWMWPFHLVILSSAIIFQEVITIRVWNKYKQSKRIIGLKLWQLTIISCLLVGSLYSFSDYSSSIPLSYFIEKAITVSLLGIVYWSVNLFTFKVLDKKFAPAQ